MNRAVAIMAVPSHTGGMYVTLHLQHIVDKDTVLTTDAPLDGAILPVPMQCDDNEKRLFVNRVVRAIMRALEDQLWDEMQKAKAELTVVPPTD